MRLPTFMMIAAMTAGWTLTAAADPPRDFSDGYYDAGSADRLIRVSQATSDRPERVIHAQPLTTVRVDTASTRAVDRRRAAESGVVVRPTPRAYVVTNPTIDRSAERERRAEPFRATSDRERAVDLSATRYPRVSETARYLDTRPDPVTDQIGAIRAQPPVARVHDGIEPANHRYIHRERPRVQHVTRQTIYTRPVHDLHVAGSGHEQWHTRTVLVDYPRYRYVLYPKDFYFAGGPAYGYHRHWEGYGPSYHLKADRTPRHRTVDVQVGGY